MKKKTTLLMEDEEFKKALKQVNQFYLENVYITRDYNRIQFKNVDIDSENVDIREKISYLARRVRSVGYTLTTSFAISLQSNIWTYLKKDVNDDTETWINKWGSLCYSFQSFLASVEAVDSFQKYQMCTSSNKKSILALCTVNDVKEVFANDEIQEIKDKYYEEENVFVFPIFGCTFDVFKTILQKWNFDIIHICGHGYFIENEPKLGFVDKKIGYKAFTNAFKNLENKKELTFLNCCFSYEFVKEKNLPFSTYTISHAEELSGDFGMEIALSFYELCKSNQIIPTVWQKVKDDCNRDAIDKYHFL